jgi:hypothetical protein
MNMMSIESCQFYINFHAPPDGRGRFILAPDAGEGNLDFSLNAGAQFAIGGDQRLPGPISVTMTCCVARKS